MKLAARLFLYWLPFLTAGVLGATREEVYADLEASFQAVFEAQNEASAAWIGVYDPLLQEYLYFAMGNVGTMEGSNVTIPATVDQHMDIGSITKTVAATVVLMLVEDGVFALDDTIELLLPDLAQEYPMLGNFTINQLLRMQTPIPDVEDDTSVLFQGDFTIRFNDIEAILEAPMDRFPLPESELPHYSSTNFLILELIVDTIMAEQDTSLRQLVQERVLDPLGLNETDFPELNATGKRPEPVGVPIAGAGCANRLRLKYGFEDAQQGDDIEEFSQIVVFAGASGSISMNIRDLTVWANSAVGDSLLSAGTVALRHEYTTAVADGQILYGMAQWVYSDLVTSQLGTLSGWYGHNGGTYGYVSAAYSNDNLNGAAFAYVANSCGETNLEPRFIDIYTINLLRRIAQVATPTAAPSMTEATSPPTVPSMTDSPSTVVTDPPVGGTVTEPPTSGSGSKWTLKTMIFSALLGVLVASRLG